MEPPPAPMLLMSSIGIRTGRPPASPSVVYGGCPSNSATSVDVPPMSKLMKRSTPIWLATAAAPTKPPAGPDRTVLTAWLEGLFGRDRAAVRLEHAEGDLRQVRLQGSEVAPHERRYVSVHDRRRRAFVLPVLGQEFAGERDR